MTTVERIAIARDFLLRETPLKADCGRLCGNACCLPDADGHGGMLLFPGEEAFYRPASEWAAITQSDWVVMGRPLLLLTCQGHCPRNERPLACRIFPLVPLWKEGKLCVSLDVRAWPLCPLMPHGMEGLSKGFIEKTSAAMSLLREDPLCRAYIIELSTHLDAYRRF